VEDTALKPEQAFGIVLKAARNKQGVSQENLALMSELDRTFISLMERGLRQPTLSTMLKLAESLNLPPGLLLEQTKEVLNESTAN
jgi:transcriptional regulator with XRE-family HTH domain